MQIEPDAAPPWQRFGSANRFLLPPRADTAVSHIWDGRKRSQRAEPRGTLSGGTISRIIRDLVSGKRQKRWQPMDDDNKEVGDHGEIRVPPVAANLFSYCTWSCETRTVQR